jgi:16S rRNA (uracil1498-N3)-methyltransferase
MRRYWVDDTLEVGIPFAIAGELFKHVHIVCRQGVGDEFELLPSMRAHKSKSSKAGDEKAASMQEAYLYKVKVKDIFRHTMVVEVISQRSIPLLPKPHIHLALSLPKVKTLEDVVEKIVELGVYSLIPFYSEFSFFKSKDRIDEKSQRLRKIVTSACQQSARAEELIIHSTKSLDDVLKMYADSQKPENSRAFAFYEGKAQSLSDYWSKVDIDLKSKDAISDIWIFIGSEGGFSNSEIQKFKDFNIPSLSLGEQVLRVETACVSIVSVLKYKYGLI